jgi:hypothetical protein
MTTTVILDLWTRGWHPSEKTEGSQTEHQSKGGTPIEKNVIVTDERGNKYEATYPKRAKGLVKKGRARFIGENVLCLTARPPNQVLEDDSMNEHAYPDPRTEKTETPRKAEGYTLDGIVSRIDQILNDNAAIKDALTMLRDLPLPDGPDHYATSHKAEAIANVVMTREATNQQLLRFLERMYENLAPQRTPTEIVKFREIVESLKGFHDLDEDRVAEIIEDAANQMFKAQQKSAQIHYDDPFSKTEAPRYNGKKPKIPKMPKMPHPFHGGNPYDMQDFLRSMGDQSDDDEE